MTPLKSIVIAYAMLAAATSLLAADELLVQTGKGTNWRYSTNKSAADWNQTDYDVSQWPEGRAPLGYGRKDQEKSYTSIAAATPSYKNTWHTPDRTN